MKGRLLNPENTCFVQLNGEWKEIHVNTISWNVESSFASDVLAVSIDGTVVNSGIPFEINRQEVPVQPETGRAQELIEQARAIEHGNNVVVGSVEKGEMHIDHEEREQLFDPKAERTDRGPISWAKRIGWFVVSSVIGGTIYHAAINWWSIITWLGIVS